MTPFAVRALAPALGVEIADVDLSRPLGEPTFVKLCAALDTYSVVLLRDQRLDPGSLAATVRRFGPLRQFTPLQPRSPAHAARYLCPEQPDIMSIGNLEADGKPIAMFTNAAPDWHIDYPYEPNPVRAIALYAVETPAEGAIRYSAVCALPMTRSTAPPSARSRLCAASIRSSNFNTAIAGATATFSSGTI